MESTPQQNFNQYLLPHQLSSVYTPSMNMQINSQNYCQPYFFPHFFGYPNNILPQQAMYAPSFMASESIQPSEQNCYFVPENMSQADIEKLLLETIPDLNGTENNFEIKKFFKKFDAHLEDWPEKKKIFALKSKLFGKAKSCFILAIKSKHCNYKSIKHFILCQLIPSEYKVEEQINSIKKKPTQNLSM
uniref:Uncharacterized protein n=1 Tax=Meloidogyne enterolobii TaxID=390850 RepID=A0A6V7WMC3_MELEN|nr:unnamed protein product [Meloidogyne enterolobii]